MFFHLANLLDRKTKVMKLTPPQFMQFFELLLIKHEHIQLRIIGNLSHTWSQENYKRGHNIKEQEKFLLNSMCFTLGMQKSHKL
jgi:hypothetical protein